MLFRQFVDDDLGCASYLIGDKGSEEAVVVDPAYEIEQYLQQAEQDGVRIVRVLETHTHADHVSGHGRFALDHALPVAIHPAAEPTYEFEALEDCAEIELGVVSIRVVHTPGHRPEHCCFEVIDRERGDAPWLTLTGDSLFVGDAGRPDLASEAVEGARGLYRSLQRLMQLEDGVEIYPGHVSGSLCGAGMSSKASSTIGFERRFNRALRVANEDAFVSDATRSGVRPANMDRIVALNGGPFVGSPKPLEPVNGGSSGVILDVRPADEFAMGHAHGALNVPLDGGSFATKAGFVLPQDERVVIHARTSEQALRAARGLRAVGIFDLAGYVVGPPQEERADVAHQGRWWGPSGDVDEAPPAGHEHSGPLPVAVEGLEGAVRVGVADELQPFGDDPDAVVARGGDVRVDVGEAGQHPALPGQRRARRRAIPQH